MKVLITGVSGLLGVALARRFSKKSDVTGIYNTHPVVLDDCSLVKCNLLDKPDFKKLLSKANPEVIIHAAALTDVDLCEQKPELAESINVGLTRNLAGFAKEKSIRLVYISTDFIFDGKKGNYSESDLPLPINAYGRTKLKGEDVVKEVSNHAIVRTSIFGWNVQNKLSFPEWVIDNVGKSRRIGVFTDQITSMILVDSLAEMVEKLVVCGASGTFNIASSNSLSKYDMALKTASIFGLDKSFIYSSSSASVKRIASRPLDCSLNCSKAESLLGALPSIEDGLTMMRELESVYKKTKTRSGYYDKN